MSKFLIARNVFLLVHVWTPLHSIDLCAICSRRVNKIVDRKWISERERRKWSELAAAEYNSKTNKSRDSRPSSVSLSLFSFSLFFFSRLSFSRFPFSRFFFHCFSFFCISSYPAGLHLSLPTNPQSTINPTASALLWLSIIIGHHRIALLTIPRIEVQMIEI